MTKTSTPTSVLLLSLCLESSAAKDPLAELERYHVLWNSPSLAEELERRLQAAWREPNGGRGRSARRHGGLAHSNAEVPRR